MASGSGDIITLTGNVNLDDTLEIKKTVNIDLNNKTISADEQVFLVQGGSLNLRGEGKIMETKPNLGAIVLKGSTDPEKKDYSTVSVGKDITLEGWSGIFINHDNNKAYGVLVNMDGTINAKNDVNGDTGIGIYVNGNIQHEENSPIVNLSKTSRITSTGNGIYSAGYATCNINGAYISAEEAALGIKSGVFNILDGTIIGTGLDKTPTSGNNNGINPSGVAIQMESNPGYKGNIELYIKNGTIQSKNSNVIYEYTVNNGNTKVKNISLSGGTYKSDAKKDVFNLSTSFVNNHQEFITGGKYSSDPIKYVKTGYSSSKDGTLYDVVVSTVSVFSINGDNNNGSLLPIIITVIIVSIMGVILYFNRYKIISLLKK